MGKTNDEALARLEHKVDITLDLVMELVGRIHGIRAGSIPKMGDHSHNCPICKKSVKYVVDVQEKSVTAVCDCKTGKYAPIDLDQFAPPMAAGGKRHVESDSPGYDASGEGDPASGEQRGPQGSRRR